MKRRPQQETAQGPLQKAYPPSRIVSGTRWRLAPVQRPFRLDLADPFTDKCSILSMGAAMERQPHAYTRRLIAGKQQAVAAEILKTGMEATDRHEQRLETTAAPDLERKQVMSLQPCVIVGLPPAIDGAKG